MNAVDRAGINAALHEGHEAFIACLMSLPSDRLERSLNGKWTAAQHMEHVRRTLRPVALAMLLPKWFLRWRFGRPNRPPRDYPMLVARYKEKLTLGGRAPSRFAPREISANEVVTITAALRRIEGNLRGRVLRWSEKDLDAYLMPHPLLGKLTVREMLFFTIYHVQHHQALVERDYGDPGTGGDPADRQASHASNAS